MMAFFIACGMFVPVGFGTVKQLRGLRCEVEEWHAECLMSVADLKEITDADIFEQAAFTWLEAHSGELAQALCKENEMTLVWWWHDWEWADNSPFGATVVFGIANSKSLNP